MKMRKIIHIDMDAFYASIEQRDNPELRGKPVAVGGSEVRGVVAAASYEARTYGVRSAMSGAYARRLCPMLIFTRPRFDAYKTVSKQIRTIFLDYTDLVEPLSLDEAYLDVTDDKKGLRSATLTANEIRQRIFNTTGLTASAGISYNKFLAKMASDVNKPNGFKVILPDEADDFIQHLPIEKFYGIGKVTAQKMKKLGVHSGAELKQLSQEELYRRFGKAGRFYYSIARGEDLRLVNPNRIQKSLGAETTFREDLSTLSEMRIALVPIAEEVYERMKRADNFGRTLTLKVKSPSFQSFTRSRTLAQELNNVADILAIAQQLLESAVQDAPSIRLLGLSVSNLSKEQELTGVQLELEL
jgi:DNA polymerase IV